jgi:hypothetical protein
MFDQRQMSEAEVTLKQTSIVNFGSMGLNKRNKVAAIGNQRGKRNEALVLSNHNMTNYDTQK